MDRRDFVKKTATAAGLAAATPLGLAGADGSADPGPDAAGAPAVHAPRAVRPVVISDLSGIRYTNDGPESAVERAFRGITEGEDVLDALIAGVNIPELDPTEAGIGYGGLPNADGVVQLDACCMHGPRRWAGGVAAIEGVRTPSRVARAVAELTDHHLLVGDGARRFAEQLGYEVEDDLNTPHSRELWLEWRRRVDPGHWLDPEERLEGIGEPGGETDPDAIRRDTTSIGPRGTGSAGWVGTGGGGGRVPGGATGPGGAAGATGPGSRTADLTPARLRARADAWHRAGLSMVDDGLIDPASFHGTIHSSGIGPDGEICAVTTTSGLAWKIPGRVGDSPILGAGLYVDGDVGAAGSTGRGEANLFNLSSYLIVEQMRQGAHPKDAGMAALERIRSNTVEARLLNHRGEPAFDVRFFVLSRDGTYAGVAMYGAAESRYAVCTENGAQERPLEGLLEGSPR